MSEITTKQLGDYKLIEIPLNKALDNRLIPLDSPLVYVINAPIVVNARINARGNDFVPLNRLKLIKGVEGALITKMYLTTTTTSSETLQLITADLDIFGEIGVSQNVVLVDSLGVEYDARHLYIYTGSTWIQKRQEIAEALANITGTGNSASIDITGYGFKAVTFFFARVSGVVEISVKIQACYDGVNFSDFTTILTSVSGSLVFHIIDKPARFYRVVTTALASGAYAVRALFI